MKGPRAATALELHDICRAVSAGMGGYTFKEAAGFLDNAAVAVFDGYVTDGPGYGGKVASVIWPGAPEMIESFVWIEGKCESTRRES